MRIALRCASAVVESRSQISSTRLPASLSLLLARALRPDHLHNLKAVSCGPPRTLPLLFSNADSFRPVHTGSPQLQPEAPSSSYPSNIVSPEPQKHASVNGFEPVAEVPLVPGTSFRLTAGRAAVRVEHVAGWSDVATLRGRPAARGSWWMVSILDTGSVASSTLAGVRRAYEIWPEAKGSHDVTGSGGDDGGGCNGQDDPASLLHLTIPEKWISLDIQTLGSPVFVSKIVEADLRITTRGAPVTLGSVRALRVELDTSLIMDTEVNTSHSHANTCATSCIIDRDFGSRIGTRGSSNGQRSEASCDSGGTASGAIMGGEVSGTSISITAAGPVNVRRLVGGSMRLTANAVTCTPSSMPEATPPAAHAMLGVATAAADSAIMSADRPGIELGAVYGGRLHISTGGGAVRVGTLDCGTSQSDGHGGALTVNGSDFAISNGGGRAGGGDGDTAYSPSTDISTRRSDGDGSGSGGAEIWSYRGPITLDGLEGDAAVDSGGGSIKVLIQPGLRSAHFASHGGPVDMALTPGVALGLLEVRGAAAVQVQPDLQRHLELLPQQQALPTAAVALVAGKGEEYAASTRNGGGGGSSEIGSSGVCGGGGAGGGVPGHLFAKVVADTKGGLGVGRGPGRGAAEVLMVDAGGGIVSIQRMGWMDALRAKLEQRSGQRNKS